MYRVIRSDIYRNDEGKLTIDYYNDHHGGISTRKGKDRVGTPYFTNDAQFLNGHPVYSVYALRSKDDVELYKGLKKKDLELGTYDKWVKLTAEYIWSAIVWKNKPDVIAVPQSSSTLAHDIAVELSKIAKVDCINNAFKKNPVSEITIEIPDNLNLPDSTLQALERILDRIQVKGKFEAKSVPKKFLKFFRNVYTNDESYEDLIYNRKVLVIDDSMSSKSTMANIFDVCDRVYQSSDCYGVTVFKKLPYKSNKGAK